MSTSLLLKFGMRNTAVNIVCAYGTNHKFGGGGGGVAVKYVISDLTTAETPVKMQCDFKIVTSGLISCRSAMIVNHEGCGSVVRYIPICHICRLIRTRRICQDIVDTVCPSQKDSDSIHKQWNVHKYDLPSAFQLQKRY